MLYKGHLVEKIVIFGTGNAGRAIYRAFKDSYKIVAFIDNNKDMIGKSYEGIAVFAPDECRKLEFDYIAYSGVWHKQMRAQLESLNISSKQIKHINESELVYMSSKDELELERTLKELDLYLRSKNILYFLVGSAGINVLRGRSLACSSDVDFYVLNYSELEALAKDESFGKPVIRYFEQNNVIKYSIKRINICGIDIGCYHEYGEYRITDCDSQKFFYMPKYIFEAGVIRKKYKDFELNMLAKYDEYFTFIYGKNYMQIPKSWSESDYGNLVSASELEKICFGKKK